jgi:hypothetical protein
MLTMSQSTLSATAAMSDVRTSVILKILRIHVVTLTDLLCLTSIVRAKFIPLACPDYFRFRRQRLAHIPVTPDFRLDEGAYKYSPSPFPLRVVLYEAKAFHDRMNKGCCAEISRCVFA